MSSRLGHNNPPEPIEPTPFDVAKKAVEDIYNETILWLDGTAIDSPEQADGVANLLALVRKAHDQADEARKAEARAFDDGKAEVQRRYHPLIGDTKAGKGKAVLAEAALKSALQPWLAAEQKRLDAEAAAKRDEAGRQRAEAEAALRASSADLAAREAAETLLHDARKAETAANVAGRATATAGGSFGRSAALRTVWRATITDDAAAVKSCWLDDTGRAEIVAVALAWADRKAKQGTRSIPGFNIAEDKSVA